MNAKCALTDALFKSVMISLWASRPEWICHWLVAPIWVKVAPPAAVQKR